jgi:hypothetical protein
MRLGMDGQRGVGLARDAQQLILIREQLLGHG